ncbi:high nitrogen upregulated cytochrome P450 monooxygenase 2 [Schizopora paradoxa]|uniref:High nitrogen upregulated cytochrome P450 monooxygenase 2 n=1 Tax=Schizopora paradoxa TaxID=27342 RepID=A0A0H2RBU2_9AGAM|nr:high nitrogen upregulated cytochrome P450 monooxygenase 2 [Schizopora paradoxa]
MILSEIHLPLLSLKDALLFTATCSLIVHAIYKRYEIEPSSYFKSLLLLGFPPALSSVFVHQSLASKWLSVLVASSSFYGILLTSIIAYRLSPFHPLYNYPGPLIAKVTKFWMMYITTSGRLSEYVRSLHDQYGLYVRIGPNEISVTDLAVMQDIFGPAGVGMPKGPIWDARRNPDIAPSLVSLRDLHEHARQRKPWNRAFSTSAVKDYEVVVARRALQLADCLEKASAASQRGVDLSKWFGHFAFDFMGDMAFGGGFELMRDGDKDGIWALLEARVKNLAFLIHIPWATRLLLKFPSITGSVSKFRNFTVERARIRKEKGSAVKDLYYHLTNEDGAQLQPPTVESILSNGELAVVAGSDTTANTLSGVFYYLLTHPRELVRLREEVDHVFPRGGDDAVDAGKLLAMPVLNAVINETLRLQPALPTYTERAPAKGSGGHWIGQRFVPEGTAVVAPIYSIHRDPANFSPLTDEFRPERWFEKNTGADGKWNTSATAFMPFSVGTANCTGKNLAMGEMRAVVAVLVQRFEIAYAEGYDVSTYEKDLQDRFIMQVGELRVSLKAR